MAIVTNFIMHMLHGYFIFCITNSHDSHVEKYSTVSVSILACGGLHAARYLISA
jgi:hypothetical protein